MTSTNKSNKELSKTKTMMKEGYDKLIKKYSEIDESLKKVSTAVSINIQPDNESLESLKDDLDKIIKDFHQFKESFKAFVAKISSNLNSIFQQNEQMSTSDLSKEFTITPRIKTSYDKISNEFTKLEKITKDVLQCKAKIKQKKKRRIKLLEQQLQTYCNNIKDINFESIKGEMQRFNMKNKDNISNFISNNSRINDKLLIDFTEREENSITNHDNMFEDEDDVDNSSENGESSLNQNEGSYFTEQNEYNNFSNNESNSIIKQILENGPSKEDEMIELIESILEKSSKK